MMKQMKRIFAAGMVLAAVLLLGREFYPQEDIQVTSGISIHDRIRMAEIGWELGACAGTTEPWSGIHCGYVIVNPDHEIRPLND